MRLLPLILLFGALGFSHARTIVEGGGASLPGELYGRLTFAYSLTQTRATVSYDVSSSGTGRRALYANDYDFSGSDSVIKESDYAAYPDVRMFPTVAAAVAPIYSLTLPGAYDDEELQFSRPTLVKIFTGAVANWNDSAIRADNPGVPLPNLNITVVVRTAGSGTTSIFTSGLSAFDEDFATSIGVTSSPVWPMPVVEADGSNAMTAAVVVRDGAIGYNVLSEALTMDGSRLRVAKMINKAGFTVRATAQSVGFALMERGGAFDSRNNAELVDMSAAFAWPISSFTYLVVRKFTTRKTCREREETVRFWEWVYTDPTARSMAEDLGFGVLPDLVASAVRDELVSSVLCDPESKANEVSEMPSDLSTLTVAYPVGVAQELTAHTSISAFAGMTLVTSAYKAVPDSDAEVDVPVDGGLMALSVGDPFNGTASNVVAARSALSGSSNMVVFVEDKVVPEMSVARAMKMRAAAAATAPTGGEPSRVVSFPIGFAGVGVGYSLSALSSVAGDDDGATVPPLRLSINTIARIFSGDITSWRDVSIASENLYAAVHGLLPETPIQVVVPEGRDELNHLSTKLLARVSSHFADYLASSVNASHMPAGWEVTDGTSADIWPAGFVRVEGGAVGVSANINQVPGGFGFVASPQNAAVDVADILPFPGALSGELRYSAIAVEQCFPASSFDSETTMFLALTPDTIPDGCWPLSAPVHAVIPRDLSSSADSGDSSVSAASTLPGCTRGEAAVEFLRWIAGSADSRGVLRKAGIGSLPLSVGEALGNDVGVVVECDGTAVRPRVIECGVGQARADAHTCVPCPVGTYSLDTSGICKSCPLGGYCPGGSEIWAKEGYWQLDSSPSELFQCATADACCSKPGPLGACPLNSTARCGSRRVPGSTLCAACAEDFSALGNVCVKCEGNRANGWAILALIVCSGAFLLALINVGYSHASGHSPRAAEDAFTPFKVLIDFLQILDILVPVERLRPIALTLGLMDLASWASDEWVCFFPMTPALASLSGIIVPTVLLLLYFVILITEGITVKLVLWSASDSLYGEEIAEETGMSRTQVRAVFCCGIDHPVARWCGVSAEHRRLWPAVATEAVSSTFLEGQAGASLRWARAGADDALLAKTTKRMRKSFSDGGASTFGAGSSIGRGGTPAVSGHLALAIVADTGGANATQKEEIKATDDLIVSALVASMKDNGAYNPAYMGSAWLGKFAIGGYRVTLVVFGSFLRAGLSMFACMKVGDNLYLRAQHGVKCDTADHAAFQAVAAVVVIILVVVLPLFLTMVAKREMSAADRARLTGFSRVVVHWLDGGKYVLASGGGVVSPGIRFLVRHLCCCLLTPRSSRAASGSPGADHPSADDPTTITSVDDDDDDVLDEVGINCGQAVRETPGYFSFWRRGCFSSCCGAVGEEVSSCCRASYDDQISSGRRSSWGDESMKLSARPWLMTESVNSPAASPAAPGRIRPAIRRPRPPSSIATEGRPGLLDSSLALEASPAVLDADSATKSVKPLDETGGETGEGVGAEGSVPETRIVDSAARGSEGGGKSSGSEGGAVESEGGLESTDGTKPRWAAGAGVSDDDFSQDEVGRDYSIPARLNVDPGLRMSSIGSVGTDVSAGGALTPGGARQRRRRRNSALLMRTESFSILSDSFSAWLRLKFRVWYEAWFFIRRALLIALSVFIEDPVVKSIVLSIMVIIFMLSSVHSRPLSAASAQILYDVSMAALAMIASMEVGAIVYTSLGLSPPPHLAYIAGFISLVPLLPLIAAIAPKLPKFLTKICCSCRRAHEASKVTSRNRRRSIARRRRKEAAQL